VPPRGKVGVLPLVYCVCTLPPSLIQSHTHSLTYSITLLHSYTLSHTHPFSRFLCRSVALSLSLCRSLSKSVDTKNPRYRPSCTHDLRVPHLTQHSGRANIGLTTLPRSERASDRVISNTILRSPGDCGLHTARIRSLLHMSPQPAGDEIADPHTSFEHTHILPIHHHSSSRPSIQIPHPTPPPPPATSTHRVVGNRP
jgi:hypothetical protein